MIRGASRIRRRCGTLLHTHQTTKPIGCSLLRIQSAAWTYQSAALFSSRSAPLINEKLIEKLLRQAGNSAENLSVRVVRDSDSSVVRLSEAIRESIQHDVDIIAIDIGQEIPVLKLANVKALEYRASKKAAPSKKLVEKEVRVRAGIADHDLKRKAETIDKYLQKGMNCLVAVRCKQRELRLDSKAAETTINRVLALVEAGTPVKPPIIHPEQTSGHVTLQPHSNK